MAVRKLDVLRQITDTGLVVIVRANSADEAVRIVDACAEGGAKAIEVTFTVPGAAAVIEKLAQRSDARQIAIGAGTVLDPETARIALLAGAQFIVSPALNGETARLCNRYQIPYLPGAGTIGEIIEAMECGADIVKLFPGELFGPSAIKAIRGPLPQANLLPTGGVSLQNVAEWIHAGAVAVAVGGALTQALESGGRSGVTDTARMFIEKIEMARRVSVATGQ